MKYRYQHFQQGLILLRNITAALILLAMLHGCASEQPKKIEIQPANTIPAGVKADFEAAMAHIETEEYEKSIVLFNKIINAMPNNAISYINLALVYKKLGQLKLAENNLILALNADHENPVANNEYALLYRKTGRFAEARQLYEKILDKYPNFIMARKNLGILCDLYLKDYACAMKHYEIYSDAMQNDKMVKIWLADLQNRSRK